MNLSTSENTLHLSGILLARQQLGDYNEQLTFFTHDLGKIQVTSFGSLSPRSKRRAALSSYHFLSLEIAKIKQRLTLISAEILQEIPFSTQQHAFPAVTKFLQNVSKILPPNAIDEKIFPLFKYLFTTTVLQHPQTFLNFYLHAALLKTSGLLIRFSACSLCNEECSETYHFTTNRELFGNSCPSKKSRESNTNREKEKKSLQTIHKSLHAKGLLAKNQIVATLPLLALAYLTYFQKQGKSHVAVNAEIYNKEFIEKDKKNDWLQLVRMVTFLYQF